MRTDARGQFTRVRRALLAAGVAAMGLVVPTPVVAADATAPVVPLEADVVVELQEGASAEAVARAAGVEPDETYDHAIDGFAGSFTSSELARIRRHPAVRHVVPDREVQVIPAAELPPAADLLGLGQLLDDLTAQLDGLLVDLGLQAPQAVPTALMRVGAFESPTAKLDGVDERVDATIAIIDSGVERHRDLNVVGGYDCLGENKPFTDEEEHGTGVAGTAAAIDNRFDSVGVAPGARLLSAKAINSSGLGSLSSVLCSLNWAIDPAQDTDVINMSLGWYGNDFNASDTPCGGSDLIHNAICQANEDGITVVASAGNAPDPTPITRAFPAIYPEVLAVSAITDFDGLPGGLAEPLGCGPTEVDDHFRPTSNYGPEIAISAVGVCVLTTAPGGGTGVAQGTSFSAPAVAGAAALLYARSPGITPAQVRARLIEAREAGPIPGDPDGVDEGVLDVSEL